MKNSKYIFKERILSFFRFASVRVLVNNKNKMHARTHTDIQSYAHVYTYIHINTHAHKDTHTHNVFFRDRMPEFMKPLAGHC